MDSADAAPPHARLQHACGCRAPTTPASPRRSSSSASCRRQACRATTGPPGLPEAGVGLEAQTPAPPSPARCAAWRQRELGARVLHDGRQALGHRHRDLRAPVDEEGLIYRGKRLVSWDPVLKSACPTEVERGGRRLPVAHPLPAGRRQRVWRWPPPPETMLGDTAVMVHPRTSATPRSSASGCACRHHRPAGAGDRRRLRRPGLRHRRGQGDAGARPERLRVGQRHKLPMITIFTLDAKVNDEAPEAYRGLDRFLSRASRWWRSRGEGLLVETKKHKLMVPRCARTGQIIEPMLTDQWFVAMTKPGADGQSIAQKAIDVVASGEVRFVPGAVGQHLQPVDEEHPGLVHQPPAWVGPPDPGLVRAQRRAVRGPQRGSRGVRAKPTLQPAAAAAHARRGRAGYLVFPRHWCRSRPGWPGKTIEQDLFLPSSVLVTGFDIISSGSPG